MSLTALKKHCLDLLESLPDNSVDLIITDPAWQSLDKWRNMGSTTRLGGGRDPKKHRDEMWFQTFPDEAVPYFISECHRVLRPGSHLYCFSDYSSLKLVLQKASLFDYEKPLCWNKMSPGMGYHYRATYEFIWFAVKKGEKRKLKDLSIPDVLSYRRVTGGYPTEKPAELIRLFIDQSSNENELVVDPFFGSGVVLQTAQSMNRIALGSDISDAAHEYLNKRLTEGVQIPLITG